MAMLWPMFAMVGLVFLVWLRLYQTRIGEMKARRIHPQKMAGRESRSGVLEDTRAADNFANLFELPVLFYAGCLTAYVTSQAGPVLLALAWAFVALRVVHSLIHCTYNRVMHRFQVYLAGGMCLFAFWAVLLVKLYRPA